MSLKTELEKLGYSLERVSKDFLGNPQQFRTLPLPLLIARDGGGGTNYFRDKGEVEAYIAKVQRNRQDER